MSIVFWAWIVVAVACALSESVTGGGYTLPWSAGAAIAAVLEALHVAMRWQWIAFFGASIVISVLVQRTKRPTR